MADDNTQKPGRKVKNLAGQKFGEFTVLQFTGTTHEGAFWLCRCNCGNERTVRSGSLLCGRSKSCGCLKRRLTGERFTKHGQCDSPEATAWTHIKARTLNPEHPSWKDYGGRGITICDRWRDSFAAFYEDMGPRPTPKHTIDRIENDGPYCKENCRWATRKQQSRNTRVTRFVDFRGERLPIAELAERFGFGKHVIGNRLDLGWDVERIVSTPVRRKRAPVARPSKTRS